MSQVLLSLKKPKHRGGGGKPWLEHLMQWEPRKMEKTRLEITPSWMGSISYGYLCLLYHYIIIYYIYMYILVTSIYISRYFSIGMEQLPHIHCPRSLLRSTTSKSSYWGAKIRIRSNERLDAAWFGSEVVVCCYVFFLEGFVYSLWESKLY